MKLLAPLALTLLCGASQIGGIARAAEANLDAPIATAPREYAQADAPRQYAQAEPSAPPPSHDVPPPLVGDLPSASPAPRAKNAPPPALAPAAPLVSDPPFKNPFKRDLPMTLTLTFNRRTLGELPVTLTRDSRIVVNSQGFIDLIGPLLNKPALDALKAKLGGVPGFEPGSLDAQGIALKYDPAALAVVVLHIDAKNRAVESVFQQPEDETPGIGPNKFAAYNNVNLAVSHIQSTHSVEDPFVSMDGAVHYGAFTAEYSFQALDSTDLTGVAKYGVQRRYARLVYDRPKDFQRFFLGDLDPEVRGLQGYVQIGGFGVERERQVFDAFRNTRLFGAGALLLNNQSTLTISRNGEIIKEIQLDAGQYNLRNLPLQVGSNNVQITVRDITGVVQQLQYNSYIDPIDLEPGDYEYAAYVGPTSNFLGTTPHYNGEVAFTGFFRKAIVNKPAFGVGLQASHDVQMGNLQMQFLLPNAARIQVEGAASNVRNVGGGYAATLSYDQTVNTFGSLDGLTLQLTYTSNKFATLGQTTPQNTVALTVGAQYSHAFSPKWDVTFDATYGVGRDGVHNGYTASAYTDYRVNRQWTTRFGVEYYKSNFPNAQMDGFGAAFSLIWQPNYSHRGEVRYDSRTNEVEASFEKSPVDKVGSYGYSVYFDRSPTNATLQGNAEYIGNRFQAGLSHDIYGQDVSSITSEQITTLNFGSSIAFTGGHFAIGRPISNSFAILYPHKNLGNHQVIVGDTLEKGQYTAESGLFGPALDGDLQPYFNQSIHYDVKKAPLGYDVGPGIERIRPTYRSGYSIRVGTDAFVSAMGVMMGNNGKPLSLLGGQVLEKDAKGALPVSFFTNSAGRFAMMNLKPGRTYHVTVFAKTPVEFDFEVPKDNKGLLRMNTVTLPISSE